MTRAEAEALIRERLPVQLQDELDLIESNAVRLGKASGVSDATIYQWLHGEKIPSLPAALAVARALNISLDYLVTGED